ncbi:EamA family transporter RarD [Thalassococcus sp. CAU 1522]|uniref:EamA family transporter RarD n=1 Tax=Thalassococcus arenae TaxID=2851652 RepID=A0ABS6NBL0_9RHOB|nr:EamA family transporter RarD [Thalassococcus arenae]MBV2361402.1 EamA family transporter RarD [Thalassococcus arenae]
MSDTRIGFIAIVAACVIWGLSPLFYKLLTHVPPLEVLAHRTVWSLFLFAGLLLVQGRLRAVRAALDSPVKAATVGLAAAMITVNWFLFIWSVQVGLVKETSLGYYIYPLVSVALGVVLFGERLSRLQWLAVALAAASVAVLVAGLGTAPWLPLVLATTFSIYGVLKKRLSIGPVVSVTAEILLLTPVALAWLAMLHVGGAGAFGRDLVTSLLLIASGLLTALPLVLFSRAAQLVPLSTVGLVQYLNPTLQFLCAVVIFTEPFTPVHALAFGLIWTGLALYSISTIRQDRARRRMSMTSVAEAPTCTKSSSEASAKP